MTETINGEPFSPDKLDKLARLLDGLDDEAAAEARQMARYIRAGLTRIINVGSIPTPERTK